MNKTLFDKLWDLHTVADLGNGESLLHIDRVFLHERTGSIALQSIAENGRSVRMPASGVLHNGSHCRYLSGTRRRHPDAQRQGIHRNNALGGQKRPEFSCSISATRRQGIVHVVSPEQGIALPGLTLVCPDSHSCTLGGLGALAWGIGSTDAEHALVTSTLRVRKPRTMRVTFQWNGRSPVFPPRI